MIIPETSNQPGHAARLVIFFKIPIILYCIVQYMRYSMSMPKAQTPKRQDVPAHTLTVGMTVSLWGDATLTIIGLEKAHNDDGSFYIIGDQNGWECSKLVRPYDLVEVVL